MRPEIDIPLIAEETSTFLRIVERASQIASHYELFLLLQREIQGFIPHNILLTTWGDYRS